MREKWAKQKYFGTPLILSFKRLAEKEKPEKAYKNRSEA